jgi:hypothetical protein
MHKFFRELRHPYVIFPATFAAISMALICVHILIVDSEPTGSLDVFLGCFMTTMIFWAVAGWAIARHDYKKAMRKPPVID